jgi:hypothetical protein
VRRLHLTVSGPAGLLLVTFGVRRGGGRGGRQRDAPIEEEATMAAEAMLLCARCGEAADGWKCAICGAEAREHDPGHLHVGSDRYCTLRCAGCGHADVLCTCV